MAQNVGRLGVVLALDTAEFVKGLGNATLSLSKFVDKAKPALLGASAVMTGLIAKTVAYADEIMDVADANDIAISSVMALGSALQSAGGKAENAGRLIATFTAKIDSAAQGSKGAQDAFKRVGVSLNDIATMDTDQLLDKVLKNLGSMTDISARNAIAMEVFGKAARNINWKQMAGDLDALKEKYKENEAGIKAMADSVDAAEKIFKTFIVAISKDVGEDLKATADYLERIKDLASGVGKAFGTVFEVIAVVGSDVAFVIERTFAMINTAMELGFTASQDKRKKAWAAYAEDSKRLKKELDEFQAKILDNTPKTPEEKAKTKVTRDVKSADAEALSKQESISKEFEKQQRHRLEAIVMQGTMINMSEKEKAIYEAISKIEQERIDKVLDIEQKIKEARAAGANNEVIEGLEKQKEKVYELADAYAVLAQRAIQENEAKIRLQQILTTEERKAFDTTLSNMQQLGQKNKAAFNAWKAMAIAMGIIDTYGSAISTYNSLSKIPVVGPALGIAGAAVAIAAGMMRVNMIRQQQFQGRAKGGTVVGNTPYMVGENGPELVIPQRSGTVIPNNQLSNHIGQAPQVVYNGPYIANMSAIDTQSAMQFLAKNKDSVWAANQSASRSMPASRS
jgi:hypothetical protein